MGASKRSFFSNSGLAEGFCPAYILKDFFQDLSLRSSRFRRHGVTPPHRATIQSPTRMSDKQSLDERLQRLANANQRSFDATTVQGPNTRATRIDWHPRGPSDNARSQARGSLDSGRMTRTFYPGGHPTGSGAGTAYNAPIGPPATGSAPPTRGFDQAASGPYMTSARVAMPAQQNPQRDSTAAPTRAPRSWFEEEDL